MKAELNGEGRLTVIAENGTESYALRKWMDDFVPGPDGCPSTLQIDVYREERGHEQEGGDE